ncbi:MAG: hypothetical protein ACE5GC_08805 [Acidimicrobiia bacterium]
MEGPKPETVGEALVAAFVAVFPEYVAAGIVGLGEDPDRFAAAIGDGTKWLADELSAELALPPAVQRKSPLEIFRAALSYPTAAMTAAGVEAVPRDPSAVDALPGDTFGLAPASSRELGEAAWGAHVAWGVAKAEAVAGVVPAGPARDVTLAGIALVTTNLMDRTRIQDVVTASGLGFAVWRNPGGVAAGLDGGAPAMALVDLTHPAVDEIVTMLSAAVVPTIVYGPHVDDIAMARVRALGATDVLPRSRFFRRLPDLLPKKV